MIELIPLKTGTGIPLVFFHGFLGTHRDWLPLVSHLPDWRSIGIDLPGHGTTPFMEEFLIDLPRFHLIGYSLGGRIALQYAQKHPEQIASLTLLSTHKGLLTNEEKEARWKSDLAWAHLLKELPIDEFLARWYDQPLFKPFKPDFEMRKHQNSEPLSQALLHFSLAKQPRYEIDRVLVGERDTKFRALYSNPIVIKGASHMIHLENPKQTADEIVKKVTQ